MPVSQAKTPSMTDDLLQIYTPHRLSDTERDSVRERLFLSFEGEGDRIIAFGIMHRWFHDARFAPETISAMQDTYWQWYVDIAWEVLSQLPIDEVAEVVVQTLPSAVGNFIDVTTLYFGAVAKRPVPEIEQIHARIRKGIAVANYPISFDESRERLTMQEVASAIRQNLRGNTMEFSAFLARLEQTLFGESELPLPPELSQDIAERVRSFVDLISFFLSEKVDPVLAMQNYVSKSMERQETSLDDPDIQALIGANILQEARRQTEIEGRKTLPKNEEEEGGKKAPSSPQEGSHPSVSEIQKIIDAQFQKDADGQYADIAGVLAMLSTLAERYGDEQIRDWYYFDEASKEFRWTREQK